MKITIPELSLILLVGPSGCGKSTFARQHFKPTEVVSSDFFRGMVCDDENNQAASKDAFELLHLAAAKRLAARRFTVIDATNVRAESGKYSRFNCSHAIASPGVFVVARCDSAIRLPSLKS